MTIIEAIADWWKLVEVEGEAE